MNAIKTPKEKWDSEYKTFIKNFTRDDYDSLLLCEENGNLDLADSILEKIEFVSLNDIYNAKGVKEDEKDEFNKENAYRIVQIASMQGGAKREADKKGLNNKNVPAYSIISPKNIVYFIKNGYDTSKDTPRIKILFAEKYLNIHVGDFWGDIKTTGLDNEGVFEFLNGKKPEKLIQRLLRMGTEPGDIVLDFFMGSGTTQAVAMKMKRKFIGIEQMDYIKTISVPRLQKVIGGELGGISKDEDWSGGGSFVYAELFELNQLYIKDIQRASSTTEIETVLQTIKDSNFLNIKVDLEKILQQKEAFFELTLEEQKSLLIQILDNNQLYLNYSEIDDDQYAIDEQTKAFNCSFYQEEV